MTMSSDPENFDPLLRLVAIKKYEQPPPEYFDLLAQEIRLRLQAMQAERASDPANELVEAAWFARLRALFDARPMLAGAFGVLVCGLILSGILYWQRIETRATTVAIEPAPLSDAPQFWAMDRPATVAPVSATNVAIEPQLPAGLFDSPFRAQPASLPLQSK
jgi:hypothetical protein